MVKLYHIHGGTEDILEKRKLKRNPYLLHLELRKMSFRGRLHERRREIQATWDFMSVWKISLFTWCFMSPSFHIPDMKIAKTLQCICAKRHKIFCPLWRCEVIALHCIALQISRRSCLHENLALSWNLKTVFLTDVRLDPSWVSSRLYHANAMRLMTRDQYAINLTTGVVKPHVNGLLVQRTIRTSDI